MRRPDELTISEAAHMLGVHYLTVLRWAHETVAGRPMRITYVRRDSTGRYYVDEQEIRGIAERPQLEFF